MSALPSSKSFSPTSAARAAIGGISIQNQTELSISKYDVSTMQPDLAAGARSMRFGRFKPVGQALVAFGLLAATMTAIALIHGAMPTAHPPAVLLVLPVLAAGMLYGRPAGLPVLFGALAGERLLFYPHEGGLGFASGDDLLSFFSTALAMIGSAVVASYAHRVSRHVATTEARCHNFNRDVLLAVTSGRLVLCNSDEIGTMGAGVSVAEHVIGDASDVSAVRNSLKEAAGGHLSDDRLGDFLTCVTEATTNALKYAGGATVEMRIGKDAVSAIVSDHGHGIDPSLLARATLESGFSTQNTLGMGFTLMLAMADTIALHTSEHGTKVLIRINRNRATRSKL